MHRKIVILSILILVGCASYQKSGDSPVVTIDVTLDRAHHATPNPLRVRRGHWVHFFSTGSADLEVESDVFERTGHDHGHAWARAKADAPLGEHTYKIYVGGKPELDPEVMIDP